MVTMEFWLTDRMRIVKKSDAKVLQGFHNSYCLVCRMDIMAGCHGPDVQLCRATGSDVMRRWCNERVCQISTSLMFRSSWLITNCGESKLICLIVGQNGTILYAFFQQILTDIQKFLTVTIRTKCLITLSLKVLSHPTCVATLPYVG